MTGDAAIGKSAASGLPGLPPAVRRWAALVLGLVLIWAFMFVIAPLLQKTDAVRPLAEYVRESGIDASALYYTEVAETGEAEMNIRGTFEYRPVGP